MIHNITELAIFPLIYSFGMKGTAVLVLLESDLAATCPAFLSISLLMLVVHVFFPSLFCPGFDILLITLVTYLLCVIYNNHLQHRGNWLNPHINNQQGLNSIGY